VTLKATEVAQRINSFWQLFAKIGNFFSETNRSHWS